MIRSRYEPSPYDRYKEGAVEAALVVKAVAEDIVSSWEYNSDAEHDAVTRALAHLIQELRTHDFKDE